MEFIISLSRNLVIVISSSVLKFVAYLINEFLSKCGVLSALESTSSPSQMHHIASLLLPSKRKLIRISNKQTPKFLQAVFLFLMEGVDTDLVVRVYAVGVGERERTRTLGVTI